MWRQNNAPLQVVNSYHPSYTVEPRLHEMLWKREFTENEIVLDLFSICCQMEFLCKKTYTKNKGGINLDHKKEFENRFEPHAQVEFRKMNELLTHLPHPRPTMKDFMKKHQMEQIFPRFWSYLNNSSKPSFHKKSVISGYFQRLSSLNQLKGICQQINSDLHNLTNHKYMAHQTALLYHAIADLGDPLSNYKEEVEKIFPDVKKGLVVDEGQIPHLPVQEKIKLDTLTTALMEFVSTFQEDLLKPMNPIINFMQRHV